MIALLTLLASAHPVSDEHAHATEEVACEPGIGSRRVDLLREEGKLDAAMAEVERLRACPSVPVGLSFSEGRVLLEQGEPEAAEAAILRFLRTEPRHSSGLWILADTQLAQGRGSDAVNSRRRSLDAMKHPKPEQWMAAAQELAELGRLPEALAMVDPVVKTNPILKEVVARMALQQGAPEEAEKRLPPPVLTSWAVLGAEVAAARGDCEEAVKRYEAADGLLTKQRASQAREHLRTQVREAVEALPCS